MNAIRDLQSQGQSPWLDFIRREMITSGELARLVREDQLGGVTSNPAIFEKAITGSNDYENSLRALVEQCDRPAKELFEAVAVRDVQDAADVLFPVYERTRRMDGYVSLEVSPYLADDAEGTLAEARRLWRAVGRPNLMIKVPATNACIPVIQQLIGEGINVNVTLLFARDYYERVHEAYVAGLEQRRAAGGDVSHVASVASFFVSRIDGKIDAQIEKLLAAGPDADHKARLEGLPGKAAIANARLAYVSYKNVVNSDRWQALVGAGAMPQRMLWASTGTKNPDYPDVLYVDELIGADTVNTLPPATYDAFKDHGTVAATIEKDLAGAEQVMNDLAACGISFEAVTDQLLVEGVVSFAEAFDRLLAAVAVARRDVLGSRLGSHAARLPADLQEDVAACLDEWRTRGNVRRLWAADTSLWSGADEDRWLGWLGLVAEGRRNLERYTSVAAELRDDGFQHAVLLGMGGSSLCPEVFQLTFGNAPGAPELHVLDSTDPTQIAALAQRLDLTTSVFIVASKSGSTLEPNIFKQYFHARVSDAVGADEAGRRFIAITDPGSKLEAVANSEGFRHLFHGIPSVGGRYSALSAFGLVPLAVIGVDVEQFLHSAAHMVHSCAPSVPPEENPGVLLGTVLGVCARRGRDKLTLAISPAIHDLGAWLEQLIAESTGKQGLGIIPVDREQLTSPSAYGDDRLFVYVRCDSEADPDQDRAIEALEAAGQPVVRICMPEPMAIGQEFFRWEIATAVAGAVLGIHPFDQPDVEAAKIETRKLTDAYEATGELPEDRHVFEGDGLRLFVDAAGQERMAATEQLDGSLDGYLRALFADLGAGDYFAQLAYIDMNPEHEEVLTDIRHAVRDARGVATCVGFGPRFLHSTGQAYKGGPGSGVFLQLTCDEASDLPVPGQKYSFGIVKAAQAAGDLAVLVERGRRALRVHLPADVVSGLNTLRDAITRVLCEQTARTTVEAKE